MKRLLTIVTLVCVIAAVGLGSVSASAEVVALAFDESIEAGGIRFFLLLPLQAFLILSAKRVHGH